MPPKGSHRLRWIIVSAVAVILVICVVVVAAAAGGKTPGATSGATATTGTSANATSNPAPTATTPASTGSAHHKVGETITYNNHWQVTINGVTSYQGDPNQFDPTPEAGHTYLVIEGTFKNLQSTSQPLSTLLYFELRDAQGNKYNESLLLSITPPDGTIEAGGPAHGKWAYDVPTSAHTFTLTFSDDFGTTNDIWDITL